MSPFFAIQDRRGSSAGEQRAHPPPSASALAARAWLDDEPLVPVTSSPARSRPWFSRDPLSSMPSLRESATHRSTSRTQDELQICGDFTNPPDAVTITKPTIPVAASMSHSNKPGARSAFVPYDTLQRSSYTSRPSTAPYVTKHTHPGSLQLETSRGDNVRLQRRPSVPEDDRAHRKRQKLAHPRSSPPPFVDLTDEGSPPLKASPSHRSRSQPHREQARDHFMKYGQSRSNGSNRSRPSLQSMASGSDEFNKVEDKMNVKGYGSAHLPQDPFHQDQLRPASATGKRPGTARGKSTEPIHVGSDDELQLDKEPSKERFVMDNLMRHLDRLPEEAALDPNKPSKRLDTTDWKVMWGNPVSTGPSKAQPNAATTVTTNHDDSEDELSQEVPRAMPKQREKVVRQFDTTEKTRKQSSYNGPRQPKFIEFVVGGSPAATSQVLPCGSALPNFSARAAAKSLRWPLKLFHIPHSPSITEPDMHLVWEHEAKRFGVHGKDGIIPVGQGVLSVEPLKVNRVVLTRDESTKVMVDGSSKDGQIYKRLLEFMSTSDRDDFDSRLLNTTRRVIKTGNNMDKMFAKIDQLHPPRPISKPVDEGLELAMLESRDSQRRQEPASHKGRTDKAHPSLTINGRPRSENKLISQMQVDPSHAESSTRTSRAAQPGDPLDRAARTQAPTQRTRANDYHLDSRAEDVETDAEPRGGLPPMQLPEQWKHPLVYPPTGRQRAQVDWADLLKLGDDEFLNDSIISFYMTWAAKQAEERGSLRPDKVYWFNTYFYSTLTKLATGQRGINYAGVQRWTSKVDIFSYDYVVIPINEDQHWYLAIICNLPGLAKKIQNQVEEPGHDDVSKVSDLPRDGLAAKVHDLLSGKQEPPSETVKGSEDAGDAMEVDQAFRGDRSTSVEKLGKQPGNGENGDKMSPTMPQISADEAGSEAVEEIKVLPDGQEDVSKLSPGGKKGRRKPAPAARKLDADQPIIIMLDSLELTHPKTTKNLKSYLVEEGKAKRGMDIDMKSLQGTTAKCIPRQTNYCDCGIFVCLYFQKFINDADDFVHKIFRREMDKTNDWPDICPPKTRREILNLLVELEQQQKKERGRQRKKKREEKKRELEGLKDGSSALTPKLPSPSELVVPEKGHEPDSKTTPALATTTAAPEAEPQLPSTPPPPALDPKAGRNPVVVVQESPAREAASAGAYRKSPRKHTPSVEPTKAREVDITFLRSEKQKRRQSSPELGDDDVATEDAVMAQPIEVGQLDEEEQDNGHEQVVHERADDDHVEVVEVEHGEYDPEIPDSQPDHYEIAALEEHWRWKADMERDLGKQPSPSRRRMHEQPQQQQQNKRRKTTSPEIIEIDDSQP